MNADCFTYSQEPYYQERIFNLFGFAHSELKKAKEIKKYSRKDILEKHQKHKGKSGSKTKLELEDFLRNDLVENYLTIFKSKHNLNNFHFVSGTDEINEGVTTGSLDIKVIFPSSAFFSGEEYLAIECKRINKLLAKKKYYIDQGLNRFLTRQYYPHSKNKVAWMLSFMECEKDSQREQPEDIILSFNQLLYDTYQTNTINKIGEKAIELDIDPNLVVFNSLFRRIDRSELIIYHVFLDYYDLIEL